MAKPGEPFLLHLRRPPLGLSPGEEHRDVERGEARAPVPVPERRVDPFQPVRDPALRELVRQVAGVEGDEVDVLLAGHLLGEEVVAHPLACIGAGVGAVDPAGAQRAEVRGSRWTDHLAQAGHLAVVPGNPPRREGAHEHEAAHGVRMLERVQERHRRAVRVPEDRRSIEREVATQRLQVGDVEAHPEPAPVLHRRGEPPAAEVVRDDSPADPERPQGRGHPGPVRDDQCRPLRSLDRVGDPDAWLDF